MGVVAVFYGSCVVSVALVRVSAVVLSDEESADVCVKVAVWVGLCSHWMEITAPTAVSALVVVGKRAARGVSGAPWLSDVPEESAVVWRMQRWVDEWLELVVVEARWESFTPDVADHVTCGVAVGVVVLPGAQVHRALDWCGSFVHWKASPVDGGWIWYGWLWVGLGLKEGLDVVVALEECLPVWALFGVGY